MMMELDAGAEGGTVKRQLGSGLSPHAQNALPRVLPRDSATRRCCALRQSTAPRGGTVKPQLGSGFFRKGGGGSYKRQPLLAKEVTGTSFAQITQKTMSETGFSLTWDGRLANDKCLRAVGAAVRAKDGQAVAMDGQEEERNRVEGGDTRTARRRAGIVGSTDSTVFVGAKPQSRGPGVCDRRVAVKSERVRRVAIISEIAWSASGSRGSEALRRAGGTVKQHLGSGQPPFREPTLPALGGTVPPSAIGALRLPTGLAGLPPQPAKPVSFDARPNRPRVEPVDQRLTSSCSPSSHETEVPGRRASAGPAAPSAARAHLKPGDIATMSRLAIRRRQRLRLAGIAILLAVAPAAEAGELGAVGDLYVADESDDRVRQFDGVTGELVGDFASGASYASGLVWALTGISWSPA